MIQHGSDSNCDLDILAPSALSVKQQLIIEIGLIDLKTLHSTLMRLVQSYSVVVLL